MLLLLSPFVASAQIKSGRVLAVVVDSVYPETHLTHSSMADGLGTDTLTGFVDGVETVFTMDSQKPFAYEHWRDTVEYLFTDQFVLWADLNRSGENDLYRLLDKRKKQSMNILDFRGSLTKMTTFRFPEDFYQNNSIKTEKECDKHLCDSLFSSYKQISECIAEVPSDVRAQVKQIQICYTPEILLPLKLFVNYPEHVLGCPIRYTIKDREGSHHFYVLSVDALSADDVIKRSNPQVLKYLKE